MKRRLLGLLIFVTACTPTMVSNPAPAPVSSDPMARNPFKAGQVWILEGTKSTTKTGFNYQIAVDRIVRQSATIDFVYASSDSGIVETTYQYSTFRSQIVVFVDVKNSNSSEQTVCFFRGFVPEESVNTGYAWTGTDSNDLSKVYNSDDFSRLGTCKFSKNFR
jgi:hypothetical protein